MKNKINKTKKQPNKNMLNKANHKTRLTQKVKQNTQEIVDTLFCNPHLTSHGG